MIATYDLGAERPTFDFCTWLARVSQGGYAAVSILPGPVDGFQRAPNPPVDPAERRHMLENVMVPAVPRFGLRLTDVPGRTVRGHDFRHVVENWRAGREFRRPTPSDTARRLVAQWVAGPYVTITMRRSRKHPARNSNGAAWALLADRLAARFRVCIVPDTEDAGAGGEFGWAAVNLDLRLALYAGATLNLGVNNGPTSLLCLMDAPYLLFKQVVPSVGATSGEGWRRKVGIAPGEQFPWVRPGQRLAWRDDDADSLLEETAACLG